MELVVDTSVVVAALLKQGTTRNLIFSPFLRLYSRERLEPEILRNKEKFKEFGGLTNDQFYDSLVLVLKQIEIIPFEEYAEKEIAAREICKQRDESDWPFIALALKLNATIWSTDPDLIKGQTKVKVLSTSDLIKILSY